MVLNSSTTLREFHRTKIDASLWDYVIFTQFFSKNGLYIIHRCIVYHMVLNQNVFNTIFKKSQFPVDN